jgi:hypothetical protein
MSTKGTRSWIIRNLYASVQGRADHGYDRLEFLVVRKQLVQGGTRVRPLGLGPVIGDVGDVRRLGRVSVPVREALIELGVITGQGWDLLGCAVR